MWRTKLALGPLAPPYGAGLARANLELRRREILAWLTVLGLAALWPLLVFKYPPLQDAPNHLARVFILLHPDDPTLGGRFIIDWNATTNLAWDSFGIVVGQWLALDVTLKLFLLLSFGLTIAGTFMFNRLVAGRWTWMPLLVLPLLFNAAYTRGFLSFTFALGLMMLACAFWISQGEPRWRRRLAIATLLSTALFFSHLVAWGCYGLFVLAQKLDELRQQPGSQRHLGAWVLNLGRDGLQALPPLAIVAAGAWAGDGAKLLGPITEFEWPWQRINKLSQVIYVGAPVLGTVVLLVLAVSLLWLLWTGRARLTPAVGGVLPILAVLFFVMPDEIFATHFIVWRLALVALLIGIAGSIPTANLTAAGTRALLTLVLVVTLGLSAWQAYSARNSEADRQVFLALVQRVPAGSTMFVGHAGLDPAQIEFDRIGSYHIGAFAVFEARLLVQSLFANPAQQPIAYREPALANVTLNGRVFTGDLATALRAQGLSAATHIAPFDWLVLHGPDVRIDAERLPLENFRLIDALGNFRLYCRTGMPGEQSVAAKTLRCPDGSAP